MDSKNIAEKYRNLLRLEEKAQVEKHENGTLGELLREGLAINRFRILRKRFGFGDYPVLKIAYAPYLSVHHFKEGMPVQLVGENSEENCNGRVLYMQNGEGEIALFTDDFEDWIEDKGCVIKIIPDNKSFSQMQGVLKIAEQESQSNAALFLAQLFGAKEVTFPEKTALTEFQNKQLNDAQKNAVQHCLADTSLHLLHGPPGTGKTTTLTEAVVHWVKQEKRILVTAPANAAIDHFGSQLLKSNIPFVRLGNVHKTKDSIWDYTPEGILQQPAHAKALKKLKIQAEEYRKMANQYKRSFGKEEREQRNLLRKHYRALKKEIVQETDYILEKELSKVQVVIGTPVALQSNLLANMDFDVVVIDEAGQCLLPMALLAMNKAPQVVLAGDPFQLPPTVISEAAQEQGLAKSVLELAFEQQIPSSFLNIQYRMPPKIAGFSSRYFYGDKLLSHKEESEEDSFLFIDTAGADYREETDESKSKFNQKELDFIQQHLSEWVSEKSEIVFISPYSAQVALAKKQLPDLVHCATIDSFQGQEAAVVIISLVRSNEEGNLGFLSEYRRMNVALTRAQQKLIVVGDSATIGNDAFYGQLMEYVEEQNAYKSVFEYADFM